MPSVLITPSHLCDLAAAQSACRQQRTEYEAGHGACRDHGGPEPCWPVIQDDNAISFLLPAKGIDRHGSV